MVDLVNAEKAPIKYSMFPVAKNKIVVRFANIGDKFDSVDQTVYVSVRDFANYIWQQANGDAVLNSANIRETTLTTNQDVQEAAGKKTAWRVEDDRLDAPLYPRDKKDFNVALQQ